MPTFTVRPGIYLTPQGAPMTATKAWERDGVAIPGETGDSYTTVSPADDGEQIDYVEQAGNAYGVVAEQRLTLQDALSWANYTASFSNSYVNLIAAFPEAARTRSLTFAMRFTGNIGFANPPATFNFVTLLGVSVQSRHWESGTVNRIYLDVPFVGSNLGFAPYDNTIREVDVALLITVDYDASLPGGKTLIVYGSIDGGTPVELVSSTTFTGSGTDKLLLANLGSQHSTSTNDGTFSLQGWFWADNSVVVDPAASWSAFFNADGTVKNLALDGTVTVTDEGGSPQTVTPLLFIAGDDWGSTGATINNRGTGADLPRAADPITVTVA